MQWRRRRCSKPAEAKQQSLGYDFNKGKFDFSTHCISTETKKNEYFIFFNVH